MKLIRILVLLALTPLSALGAPIMIAENLSRDTTNSGAEQKPVVVLYTASYCEYCETVKSEFFNHIAVDKEYTSRIILREVVIDSRLKLKNFNGKRRTHRKFADNNGVSLVPTVGFYDKFGNVLVKPMVGVTTMHYYGYYVDKHIDTSLKLLQKPVTTRLASEDEQS